LKFTKKVQTGNIIVFGLHLFSSHVIKEKLFRQANFAGTYHQKVSDKSKFTLHSDFKVSQ
jgi:hypothetical protein